MPGSLTFKKWFYGLLIVVGIMGCRFNNSKDVLIMQSADTVKSAESNIDFTRIDSVEFIYLKTINPQNQTKSFYIKDTTFINTLKTNLVVDGKPTEECTHEVKLYLYKNGSVYKTAYAALNKACNYLAYAVNGKPVFMPLSPTLQQLLRAHLKSRDADSL